AAWRTSVPVPDWPKANCGISRRTNKIRLVIRNDDPARAKTDDTDVLIPVDQLIPCAVAVDRPGQGDDARPIVEDEVAVPGRIPGGKRDGEGSGAEQNTLSIVGNDQMCGRDRNDGGEFRKRPPDLLEPGRPRGVAAEVHEPGCRDRRLQWWNVDRIEHKKSSDEF